MHPDRWRLIDELFHQTVDLKASARITLRLPQQEGALKTGKKLSTGISQALKHSTHYNNRINYRLITGRSLIK